MKVYFSIFLLLFITIHCEAQESGSVKKSDTANAVLLNEVVVSASRMSEKILRSPVSIEKVNEQYFRQSAAPSFFDALENVKGVQMITPSAGFKVINTRGFANTTNVRFTQMVDGMDIQAPHLGAPIANALGPNDLDIESVEIIPGTSSALYGMNASNGLANFITKNPFSSTGLSIQQKTGVNHIADSNSKAKIFTETSIRYAHAFSSKFAFKINGTFTKGYDWVADDRTDLNATANTSVGLTGNDNPGFDPVNGYGNESSNRRALTLQGKSYVVARSGYYEKQIADYNLQNTKADVTFMYKPNAVTNISYAYKVSMLDNIYQRSNRFRLEDYIVQQHAVKVKSGALTAHAYWNLENTGESFNLRSMAENTDRAFKSDDNWFKDYTNRYNSSFLSGQSVAMAHQSARLFADSGRYIPGTAAFDSVFNKLKNINNWDSGAALRVKANLINVDAQFNLTENLLVSLRQKTGIELLIGADYRNYIVVPDGNYFINPDKDKQPYDNLEYGKIGGFVSATKELFSKKLKVGAALRADKNDFFPVTWNPRFTAVYSPVFKHNFRIAYQSGSRFPSLFEGFSNVNSGGVKRVGGLKVMSDGVFENSYLKSSIDAFKAAVVKDVNTLAITKDSAIKKNAGMLKENNYTYLQPEHVSSLELGYKGLLFGTRLYIDVDFYYNHYSEFIAQVEASIPKTKNPDSIAFALNDNKTQDRYRLWTNSKTTVYNYGGSVGLKYVLPKGYLLSGNVTYAKLDRKKSNDGLEDGFNTPEWITNVSLANNHIVKNFGAGVTYKWQCSYYWQSFLVNGDVPAYGNVDLQLNYTLTKLNTFIKIGATNLLNQYYNSILGGPSIGGFYYATITYSPIK